MTDKERLAALESYEILDTPPEQPFDDIVSLAALVCAAPTALVSFVDRDRQWFKARIGFEPAQTELAASVCAHSLDQDDLLVIPDLSKDIRAAENPLVVASPHMRFYAGAPLRTNAGEVLGTLCVIDTSPRPEGLTETQATALRNLARQVMSLLELRLAVRERDEAEARRLASETRRRSSETQFNALFEAIEDGFCIVEMKFEGEHPIDYRFIETNPAFAKQTGLANAEGKWMRELAPKHEEHWFARYGKVAETGEPTRFEHHAQELGGRWYDVHAFAVGDNTRNLVGILFNDITDRKIAQDLKIAAEHAQEIRNHELSHRMKNTFSMVIAIASQTLRSVPDRLPVEAFLQRLHALSAAHDVLLKQSWTEANLQDVAASVLSTLADENRFILRGPAVLLGPRATLSMSLLMHELGTNALKYGALSTESGRVSIGWDVLEVDGAHQLVLDWWEQDGPTVEEPKRKGFGSRLINMGLLGTGGVSLRYDSSGFRAEFKAPIAQVQQS